MCPQTCQEQQNQFKEFVEQKNKEFDDKLKEEVKKVKSALEKEQIEVKAFYEKKNKELENKFDMEIKKVKTGNDQTTKALESKIVKERESFGKETNVIADKLEKAEKITNEVKKQVEKIREMKENQSKDVEIPQNKPKPRKLTKEDEENEVIAEFESDEKDIFEARKNCGLNLTELKCNKCSFETHSEETIKKHKRTAHQIKESNQNDIFHHFKLLRPR